MCAMVIDANKVNSSVMPNLIKAKSNLEEAYKISNTLLNKLPSTAGSSRSKVSSIKNKITTNEKKITTIKSKITNKIEKAKSIESKNKSKTAGLASAAGAAAGIVAATTAKTVGKAVVGSSVGAAIASTTSKVGKVGAVAAGIVATQTGAMVAANSVSKSKSLLEKAFDFVKDTGSKIVQSVKSGWNKFTTGVKKVVDKTTTVIKTAATKLKNTGAKIANSVQSIAKKVVTGTTNIIDKVKTGCKTIATKTKSFVQNKMKPAIIDVGKKIITANKLVYQKYKELQCSVANTVMSIVEGLVSFGEAIIDTCTMAVGAVTSIPTALVDVASGLATKDWSFKATKSLWKDGVMPAIGKDWTGTIFGKLYETKVFKEIEENAWKPFKREGGVVYDVGKAVGYYTGLIALTTVTAGAGSIAATTTIGNVTLSTSSLLQAGFAAAGSLGKNTQKNYNSELKKYVNDYYIEQQLQQNPNLTKEEATAIVAENIKNKKYSDYDLIYEQAKENISYGKVIGKSYGQAAIDGTIMLAAGSVESVAKAYKGTSKVAAKVLENHKDVSIAIKASKSYITEGFTTIIDKDKYDFRGATIDALGTIVAEKAAGSFKNADKAMQDDNKSDVSKKIYSAISKIKYKGNPKELNLDKSSKEVVTDLSKILLAKGEERVVKEGTGAAYDTVLRPVLDQLTNLNA